MHALIWDGPCAVTESHHGIALGYYVDCDSALCRDCIPDASAWAGGDYAGWPGFEDWESPAAIFNDTESDSPTHCAQCGAVIAHDLTPDGTRYVMDAIAEFCADGGHHADVMAQWWDAYADTLNENDLALIAGTFASPANDADKWDLREIIESAMIAQGVREYIPASS